MTLPSAPIVRLEVCVDSVRSTRAALTGGAHAVELCSGLVDGGITPSLGLIAAVVGVAAESLRASVAPVSGAAAQSDSQRLRVNVLIRCRPGDFLYDDDEMDVMLHDIRLCGASGADGVVVGALTADGAVDERALRRMIEAAGEMKVCLISSNTMLIRRPLQPARHVSPEFAVLDQAGDAIFYCTESIAPHTHLQVTFHRAFDMCADPAVVLEVLIRLGVARLLTSGLSATALQGKGFVVCGLLFVVRCLLRFASPFPN